MAARTRAFVLAALPCCLAFSATTRFASSSRPAVSFRADSMRATLVDDAVSDAVVAAPLRGADELLTVHPGPDQSPRDVIDTMMSAIHRDHLNSLVHPYLGCEVALRFLASTHQAASFEREGGPPAFERYLRQPHKQSLTTWREYRPVGDPIVVERSMHPWEAYQQLEVRAGDGGEWSTIRWLLLKQLDAASGEASWRVEGIYTEEPDEADPQTLYDELRVVSEEAPLDSATQRRLFDEFDEDGSGLIDEGEIWRIVRRLGIQVGGREGLRALYDEADADGSGELDFDEFSALLQRVRHALPPGTRTLHHPPTSLTLNQHRRFSWPPWLRTPTSAAAAAAHEPPRSACARAPVATVEQGCAKEGGAPVCDFGAALARSATTEGPREVVEMVMNGLRWCPTASESSPGSTHGHGAPLGPSARGAPRAGEPATAATGPPAVAATSTHGPHATRGLLSVPAQVPQRAVPALRRDARRALLLAHQPRLVALARGLRLVPARTPPLPPRRLVEPSTGGRRRLCYPLTHPHAPCRRLPPTHPNVPCRRLLLTQSLTHATRHSAGTPTGAVVQAAARVGGDGARRRRGRRRLGQHGRGRGARAARRGRLVLGR